MNQMMAMRVEASEADHWASQAEGLAAMPGNPYGAAVRRFGRAVALACPGMPSRPFVNRVLCAGPGDEDDLDRAAAWLKGQGVPVRVDVSPLHADERFLARLADAGYAALGFQTALYAPAVTVTPGGLAPTAGPGRPEPGRPLGPDPGLEIRLAETDADFAFVAAALPEAFGSRPVPWRRCLADAVWATARRPGWTTYLALAGGTPAAFAQLYVEAGVGSLALAGTLPAFRGLGAQTALIRRRIADARAAGCDLLVSQTGNGTVSQQNLERAGFRVAYTKAEFVARG